MWEACPACRAPVMIERAGTLIGLSAREHKCWGQLPDVMECHCGEAVWIIRNERYDLNGNPHSHEQPPAEPEVEQPEMDPREQPQEAWGLKIGADRLP